MTTTLLAAAATPADLVAARSQMALSLGWHIVVACLGVGMPAITLLAEWRGQRTGDPAYRLLARRWRGRWACCSPSVRCPARSCRSRRACCGPA